MFLSRWPRFSVLFLLITSHVAALQSDVQRPLSYQGNSTIASCHEACTALSTTLGDKVYYQTTLPDELFTDYFSARQSAVRPLCLILPTTAEDVSEAIKILNLHTCIFAVKSGGHAMFPGASNAENGVTFDMRYLNGLGISEDRETAFVGTGNRWGAVYDYLDRWNLTVIGGRDSQVGVGGFLLGGGVSFISKRYGWGLDNVRNYEIVLANGSITSVSYSTHPDLYWALRGGGNNFGIITRFDLETKPLVPMWGGFSLVPLGELDTTLQSLGTPRTFTSTVQWLKNSAIGLAFGFACRLGYCGTMETFADLLERLAVDGNPDPHAHAYIVMVLFPYINRWAWVVQLNHGQGQHTAPAFGDLVNLKKIWHSNRLANATSFANEIAAANPNGYRMVYRTATFRLDKSLVEEIMKIMMAEIDPLRLAEGLMAALPLMLITKDEIAQFSKNGGNSLGLEKEESPLLLLNVSFRWKNEADDEALIGAAKRIIDRSVALAKARGLDHRFIYQNYAAGDQEVFEGYGPGSRERLRSIQKKYDPDGIFSKWNPGYFKV